MAGYVELKEKVKRKGQDPVNKIIAAVKSSVFIATLLALIARAPGVPIQEGDRSVTFHCLLDNA